MGAATTKREIKNDKYFTPLLTIRRFDKTNLFKLPYSGCIAIQSMHITEDNKTITTREFSPHDGYYPGDDIRPDKFELSVWKFNLNIKKSDEQMILCFSGEKNWKPIVETFTLTPPYPQSIESCQIGLSVDMILCFGERATNSTEKKHEFVCKYAQIFAGRKKIFNS